MLNQLLPNSVAVPVIEYRAITECGRILTHSATSAMSAMFEIKRDRFMSVSEIEPYKDWQARQSIKEVAIAS